MKIEKEEKSLKNRLRNLEGKGSLLQDINSEEKDLFIEDKSPVVHKKYFKDDDEKFRFFKKEKQDNPEYEFNEREKEDGIISKDFEGKLSMEDVRACVDKLDKIKQEMSKIVVGQEKIINGLLRGLLCDGHVLLEGIPGIAKTLTIRALGEASGCSVNRIQFTVDLLPTDILGITAYTPKKGFETIKGPIFANFLIADEINRSPPKTQSALIEAMQERQVTIGKIKYPLPSPFFVMATKNPIENLGVYPLPEAQMDRFLFNIIMSYPENKEELKIMEQNITLRKFEDYGIKSVITPEDLINIQNAVKGIYLSESVKSYILSIVTRTRDKDFEFADLISYGASPRASIALYIASKARALMEGRNYVLPEDVKEVAYEVLRHRVILSYKATIRNVDSSMIIKKILDEASVF